jgi:hypothetical protein
MYQSHALTPDICMPITSLRTSMSWFAGQTPVGMTSEFASHDEYLMRELHRILSGDRLLQADFKIEQLHKGAARTEGRHCVLGVRHAGITASETRVFHIHVLEYPPPPPLVCPLLIESKHSYLLPPFPCIGARGHQYSLNLAKVTGKFWTLL